MKGKVKFFNVGKGFGFIAGEDGNEYFVHVSALGDGVTLSENDAVEFVVEQGDRGPKAAKVKKVSASSSSKDESSDEEASDEESTEDDSDEDLDEAA